MSARQVLAWQICTGCALTRELLVTLDEAKRLQALPIAEHEQHDGCYPRDNATRSQWLTNGARWAPSRTDRQPPASASETKGGEAPVGPDGAKRPDLVTPHEA